MVTKQFGDIRLTIGQFSQTVARENFNNQSELTSLVRRGHKDLQHPNLVRVNSDLQAVTQLGTEKAYLRTCIHSAIMKSQEYELWQVIQDIVGNCGLWPLVVRCLVGQEM